MSQRNKILRNIMSENNGVSKALDRINSLKRKIILVVKKNKLIGTVTDGDLRNALFLRKKSISSLCTPQEV